MRSFIIRHSLVGKNRKRSMIIIILAGILALPAFLVYIVSAPFLLVLSLPSIFLLLFRKESVAQTTHAKDDGGGTPDHVVITGGSSGIGLGIAKDCVVRKIKKVTILARNQGRLDDAKFLLKDLASSSSSSTEIACISVSVADPEAIAKVAKDICKSSDRTILFNCAGTSVTNYYQDVRPSDYVKMVQTNQLGAIHCSQAFLPYLTDPKGKGGTIVLTSSAAGQVGVYGYTGYSPTKFALRGFAEALHMELAAVPNVHVQIAFPADTDTPGYQEELATMPSETKALNDSGGLADADRTAQDMVSAAFHPNPTFAVYFTFEAWMLTNLTAGMSPVSSLFDAITQVVLGSTLRFISLFYLNSWWHTIRTMASEKQSKSRSPESKTEKNE